MGQIARVVLAAGFGLAALSSIGCGSGILGGGIAASSVATPLAVASGPQLGYIWSGSDSSLRPILGVPGSSQIGAAIAPPGAYIAGAASAMTASALLEEADGSLVAMQLPNGASTRVASGMAANLLLEYAPSGRYAIAYTAGGSSIAVISGLPDKPQVQTLQSVSAGLARAAVGDNGQVVAASGGASGLVVALLSSTGKTMTLTSVGKLGGMAMVPQQDAAIVVDAANGSVVLLHNISAAFSAQPIPAAGLSAPVGVAASQDGHWAVIANSADKSLVRVDLTGGAPLKIACACQPNQVSPLQGNAVFRATDIGAGPAWMVDASLAVPQTLFIPAVQLSGTSAAAHP